MDAPPFPFADEDTAHPTGHVRACVGALPSAPRFAARPEPRRTHQPTTRHLLGRAQGTAWPPLDSNISRFFPATVLPPNGASCVSPLGCKGVLL